MKYVLLAKISPEWTRRWDERVKAAVSKMKDLGITVDAGGYTQGEYDFIDFVDCKDPQAVLAYSIWYAAEGFGSILTLPAFSGAEIKLARDRIKAPTKKRK